MISIQHARVVTALLAALILAISGSVASPSASAGWTAAKLVGIRPDSVQLLEQNGDMVTATLATSSILIHRGVPTLSLKDFPAHASVVVRLRPPSREGGHPRVEFLADTQIDDAMSAYGKQPLVGSVCAMMPGWLVVKTDEFSTVPVELSSSTLYRRIGRVLPYCPFDLGDRVTIKAHTSTTGALIASSVADQESESEPEALPYAATSIVK